MQEQLNLFPVQVEIPVQWGEMDAARHVNNAVYIRWGESARILYFEKIGIPTDFDSNEGPILGWQDCKYIFPVTYPDTVTVGARVTEILEDRFVMDVYIFSQKHQRLAAINKNKIVPYDYVNFKKIPVPERWIQNIQQLEGKTFEQTDQ